MRALVQRAAHATVTVDGRSVGSIGPGMLIFLGVRTGDSNADAEYLAERCATLRMFQDDAGKMNLSALDRRAEALVVSQFTLYGDTRKGHRPSFTEAAPPDVAERLYEHFVRALRDRLGSERVATGLFGAMMKVDLSNDGPVTLLVESRTE